ncbi:MAG TPA: MBL fold metallo-hydrolase [Chitinophaga sp.]|uniref:MBL fold metallo-hydrolase n=1 Tax=Chitinophaga sp. TaxID=1869181 RepID=UPI002D0F352D|nr:MBL fold metallo-hydrolase [Chitinophaga sp.]HVI43546.1 MBL fold metallo-hydrolase [Chitinophaga sp.]
MDASNNTISVGTLREWMENQERVFILDVRPAAEREEWQIPGSHHIDAYKRLREGDYTVLDEIVIPEGHKVVTVCAAGRTSVIASNALRQKGIPAYSLEGGMKAWGTAWNVAHRQFNGFEVLQLRRTGKGCLSYIIASAKEAVIIDASLPLEVYQQLVRQYGLSIKYVMETHIHADHLSRSREAAALFQAPLFLPASCKVQFAFNGITADTVFHVGSIKLHTILTPGHTLDSLSFYVEDEIVLTGDTLFTNGVGRPDLKASEEESRQKATLLYQSLGKLLSLPDKVAILPAHTDKPVAFDGVMISVTIGETRKHIPLLQGTEAHFINTLLQKIPPTPANYLSIVEKNLKGEPADDNATDLEAGANRCAVS